MGSALRRFGQALEDDILRRMRSVASEYDMQKSEVEAIGEAAALHKMSQADFLSKRILGSSVNRANPPLLEPSNTKATQK